MPFAKFQSKFKEGQRKLELFQYRDAVGCFERAYAQLARCSFATPRDETLLRGMTLVRLGEARWHLQASKRSSVRLRRNLSARKLVKEGIKLIQSSEALGRSVDSKKAFLTQLMTGQRVLRHILHAEYELDALLSLCLEMESGLRELFVSSDQGEYAQEIHSMVDMCWSGGRELAVRPLILRALKYYFQHRSIHSPLIITNLGRLASCYEVSESRFEGEDLVFKAAKALRVAVARDRAKFSRLYLGVATRAVGSIGLVQEKRKRFSKADP